MNNGNWNGMDGGNWWWMSIMMIIVVGGLIWVGITIARHGNQTPHPQTPGSSPPPTRATLIARLTAIRINEKARVRVASSLFIRIAT